MDVGLGKLEIKFSAGREARLVVSVGERSQSRGGSPSSYTGMGRLTTVMEIDSLGNPKKELALSFISSGFHLSER